MFMIVLAQIGWITFSRYSDKHDRRDYHADLPALMVTLVAVVCLFMWYLHVKAKWGCIPESTVPQMTMEIQVDLTWTVAPG